MCPQNIMWPKKSDISFFIVSRNTSSLRGLGGVDVKYDKYVHILPFSGTKKLTPCVRSDVPKFVWVPGPLPTSCINRYFTNIYIYTGHVELVTTKHVQSWSRPLRVLSDVPVREIDIKRCQIIQEIVYRSCILSLQRIIFSKYAIWKRRFSREAWKTQVCFYNYLTLIISPL